MHMFLYNGSIVISVVDRAKKMCDAELIIKLARSSVREHIFRDLRSI